MKFSTRTALRLLPLAALMSTARAGVITVGPAGAHAAIQPAVDAALDGDTVLVAPGTYAGFTVDGKHLQVVAASSPVTVNGTVVLRNVAAGGSATLAGFVFPFLQLTTCAGSLRIQASTIGQMFGLALPPTVTVDQCADVALTHCMVSGWSGLNPLTAGATAARV